jgi:outer membrane protein OmpA-like peptidoglycan-associated protein
MLQSLQKQIEQQHLLFAQGRSQPLPESEVELRLLAPQFKRLTQVSTTLQQSPEILIEGRTDRVGTDRENLALSLARAIAIRDRLIALGVDPAILKPKALGTSTADHSSQSLSERRVSFKVIIK